MLLLGAILFDPIGLCTFQQVACVTMYDSGLAVPGPSVIFCCIRIVADHELPSKKFLVASVK